VVTAVPFQTAKIHPKEQSSPQHSLSVAGQQLVMSVAILAL
jgi:hypothetical protein